MSLFNQKESKPQIVTLSKGAGIFAGQKAEIIDIVPANTVFQKLPQCSADRLLILLRIDNTTLIVSENAPIFEEDI